MKTFVKVSFKFYDKEYELNMFDKIGTQGFTLYHVLLMLQGNNNMLTTSIKMIRDFCNIEGLKDKRVILNYLLALKREKLIDCKQLNKDTKLNDTLIIKTFPYIDKNAEGKDKNYSQISCDLIYDKLSKIGHIGFSIYCLLHKNHNINFGCQSENNYGFANPTRDYIAHILNISVDSVKKYSRILEKEKLIKIEEQPKISYIKPNGEEGYKQAPNHYLVKAKYDKNNKYYIGEE